ncbi:MAG: hypothetical protein RR234_09265, partial [Christensenella sp.]
DAAGNYGAYDYTHFYLDKTGPTAPQVAITPASWTKNGTVGITWSNISDINNLKSVEYKLDNGGWIQTGKVDKILSGFPVDIFSVADGEHTVSVRSTDILGNVGQVGKSKIYKDTTAPTVKTVGITPNTWTTSDTVELAWSGLSDQYSGILRAEYTVAGSGWFDVLNPYIPPKSDVGMGVGKSGLSLLYVPYGLENAQQQLMDIKNPFLVKIGSTTPSVLADSGTVTAYLTGLPDGEHEIDFKVTDKLENQRTYVNTVYRDITKPEIEIAAPMNGDIVNGMTEIWGSVKDLSLVELTLTATGETGKSVELASSAEAQDKQIIGVLNTGGFNDREKIKLTFHAKDKAGNESLIDDIVLEVDKSVQALASDVTVVFPKNGDKVVTPRTQVKYAAEYVAQNGGTTAGGAPAAIGQKKAQYYIDGAYVTEKSNTAAFDFDAITYEEGSTHTINVISEDTDNKLHYSDGLGITTIFTDAFDNEDFTQSKTNVVYAPSDARLADPSQDGEIISVLSGTSKDIMALRLSTTEELPTGTAIEYYYTIDGKTWESITTV